jgi:Tfp pilus assembly protein PilF
LSGSRAATANATGAPKPRAFWIGVGVALTAISAFLPVLDNGFVTFWDDQVNFLQNVHYRGLGAAQLRWAWTNFLLGVYQPLAWMLLEVQYAIWELDPWGYHFVSLLLHALNAALLYLLTVRLIGRSEPALCSDQPWRSNACAALAAVLFAVHPLRTEVIAWASCQPYLLCATFCLLSVLAYLRAVPESTSPARRGWLVASMLFYAAALLCKAMAAALPAVLVVLDVYPLRRLGGGRGRWFGRAVRGVWYEKAPFVVLVLIFAMITIAAKVHAAGSFLALAPPTDSLLFRISQVCYAVVFYPYKTLLPVDLVALYGSPAIHWQQPGALLSMFGTAALTLACFLLRARWPGVLAAWICYVVLLAPTVGIVRFSSEIVADRYGYIPMMSLHVLAAAGLLRLLLGGLRERRLAHGLAFGGLVAVPVLALLSWSQSASWRDSVSMWSWAIDHGRGNSAAIHDTLGLALAQAGQPAAGMKHLIEAARLAPRWAQPYVHQAEILVQQGKFDEAERQVRTAIERRPDAQAHLTLGAILVKRGRLYEAAAEYAEALRIDPNNDSASGRLATVVRTPGMDEGVAKAGWDVVVRPRDPSAHQRLADALARTKPLGPSSVTGGPGNSR